MSLHKVWKLGADIDTDALAPGNYMKLPVSGIAQHCLEAVRPEFAANVRAGDVIAAGRNFGIGSSREQAAGVLVHLGLLLLTSPDAELLTEGENVGLDLQSLTLTSSAGHRLVCEPIPDFLLDMAAAGGLLNQLRKKSGHTP